MPTIILKKQQIWYCSQSILLLEIENWARPLTIAISSSTQGWSWLVETGGILVVVIDIWDRVEEVMVGALARGKKTFFNELTLSTITKTSSVKKGGEKRVWLFVLAKNIFHL